MKRALLGRTGIEVSALGIGTGTEGWDRRSQQTALGHDKLVELLVYAYHRGITFWDSADQYGTHPHVRDALRRVPRERVVVATKTVAQTPESAVADVDRFRRELDVDQLDILLLHCLTEPDWPNKLAPTMEALSRARECGHVRALGVSCHDFGAFERASSEEWVEVVLARINQSNLHMDATWQEVSPILRRMRQAGKGVYGMKVLASGQLGCDPGKAIRFVFDLECVDAVTIGMVSREQVDENVQVMEGIPTPACPAV